MPMTPHIQALRKIKNLVEEFNFHEFDESLFDIKTRAIDDVVHDAQSVSKLLNEDLIAFKGIINDILKKFF